MPISSKVLIAAKETEVVVNMTVTAGKQFAKLVMSARGESLALLMLVIDRQLLNGRRRRCA